MELKINLATRVYLDTKQLQLWLSVAVLALAAFFFFNTSNIAAKEHENKQLRKEISATEGKAMTSGRAVTQKEYEWLTARINFANSVIQKKMYNWLDLLDRLEPLVPDGVAFSSIEPDPRDNSLKLVGVAKKFNDLRVLMENLENSKSFADVYLTSESEAALNEKTKGLTFNLTCKATGK